MTQFGFRNHRGKIGPCRTGKVCYSTEQEAKDALFLIQFQEIGWWKQRRYYFCRKCRRYHLTSQPDKRKETE